MSKDDPLDWNDEGQKLETNVALEARTTDIGIYNYARSYHAAARCLQTANFRATHADEPRRLLYFHAIELYLKSFLRLHRLPLARLKSIGHKIDGLAKECRDRGFQFDNEDNDVIELLSQPGEVFRVRYIVTGPFKTASMDALERTCSSLAREAGQALKAAGRPVRD